MKPEAIARKFVRLEKRIRKLEKQLVDLHPVTLVAKSPE